MKYELKQGDVIELENGEHWLYGENVSYRLENSIPCYWRNARFDDNMKTIGTHEQIVKIWCYDKFSDDFTEIIDSLEYKTPSWVYEERFNVGDIVRITYCDEDDVDTFIVNDNGLLVNRKGYRFCDDTFPTYDRIKNSDIVSKVELMKLETAKEL